MPPLQSIAKKIGIALAAIIIFVALCLTLSWLLSPLLDNHRPEIEKWTTQFLGMPVSIKKVGLSWYRYQPVVRLSGVSLQSKSKQFPPLDIKKIYVFFSIPRSLWNLKLIQSGVLISGTRLNLLASPTGGIIVQGFQDLAGASPEPLQGESNYMAILDWLSSQPRIILENVDLHYTGINKAKRFLTLYQLSLFNSSPKHLITGKAILHQSLATEITVAIKWEGAELDFKKIKAKIYLYVTGLSLDQWLSKMNWRGWEIKQGLASAKIWAKWQAGVFSRVQNLFQIYNVNLYSAKDKSIHKINRISGHLGWMQNDKEVMYVGDDILIDFPDHLWPITYFRASLQKQNPDKQNLRQVNVGFIDLTDAQRYMFATTDSFLPENYQEILKKIKLTGYTQNTLMTFPESAADWSQGKLNVRFKNISFVPYQTYPGFKYLSGNINWTQNQGVLTLNSQRVLFTHKIYFIDPINIDQLTGEIALQQVKADSSWHVNFNRLQILNPDLALNVSGMLNIKENNKIETDLTANLAMPRINNIVHYLPLKILDADFATWLKSAFLGGEMQSSNLKLQGALDDFPFDKQNGIFNFSSALRNVDLKFAPAWPVLKNIDGTLTFSGRRMLIAAPTAKILNIDLKEIRAELPSIGDYNQYQILILNCKPIETNFTEARYFLYHSPLESTLGKIFADVQIIGPTTLALSLKVPLSNPDETKINGEFSLKNTALRLMPWKLTIDNINGALAFTEGSVTAQQVTGVLFNKPIKLDLKTIKRNNKAIVFATTRLNLTVKDIEQWLGISTNKKITGASTADLQIEMVKDESVKININSNLVGLAFNISDQFSKKAAEARDFSAEILAEFAKPLRVKMQYSNELNTAIVLKKRRNGYSIVGASLRLGKGEVEWPQDDGLYLTGEFQQLDWDKIKTYLGQGENEKVIQLPLRRIEVKTADLTLGGQSFKQINIIAIPAKERWEVKVSSPDILGTITAPMSFSNKGLINAQFDRLSFSSTTTSASAPINVNLANFPAINFVAHNVNFNEMTLGQVNFKTSIKATGQDIDKLLINSRNMNLIATGQWRTQKNGTQTQLTGRVVSSQLSALLQDLGYDAHNYVLTNAQSWFNLQWPNAPFAPEISNLTGNARISIGQGRIVEISQGSSAKMDLARMLSMFSLQSLPRRLTLDFRDVFQKGYSFDSIQGDFNFRNGSVYTSNLQFSGPTARVLVNGRIGLRNKDYDLILSVTPYVTSTLPLAATLLTGQPLIGLAALAVNTVIDASKATTYYYVVKGSWQNPSVNEVRSGRP